MTSFATAFGSSDLDKSTSNMDANDSYQSKHSQSSESNQFSSVDLDQQMNSSPKHEGKEHSSYVSLSDAATFHTEPIVTSANASRFPPSPSQDLSTHYTTSTTFNTASLPSDRRISIPDMSQLSMSSAAAVAAVAPTIVKFKQWSRSAYKCTKQSIFEKLGKTTRTVDAELDGQIEQLRETKRRYENLLALARSYANHFGNLLQTQRALSDTFLELKHKSFYLCDEFGYNAETQNLLVHHGEVLMQALNYFISTLQTLCHKTIEDTMNTIRLYEISRLEYDACRTELEMLSPGSHLNEMKKEFEKNKEKYEKLKCDVNIKMKFLDENQTKVMKKQLLLFHNAISAYFSGNHEALAATMKQFNLKTISNGNNHPEKNSFLEQPFQ